MNGCCQSGCNRCLSSSLLTLVVYKRYASLYFVCGVDASDNELITLEIIHEFVEVLDRSVQ